MKTRKNGKTSALLVIQIIRAVLEKKKEKKKNQFCEKRIRAICLNSITQHRYVSQITHLKKVLMTHPKLHWGWFQMVHAGFLCG